MPWKQNARVFHVKLGRGGRVLDVLKSGAYRVAIGNIVVDCAEEDLAPPRKGEGGGSGVPSVARAPSRKPVHARRSAFVDLHGMRVEEALSLVERKLNEALLEHCDTLEIVHGLGAGRLKAAVHQFLSTLSVVKRYKLDDRNPGTTWAYF